MFGPELKALCFRENHPLRLQYAHFSQVAVCKLRKSSWIAQFHGWQHICRAVINTDEVGFAMAKYLVTGAAGYIGQRLVHKLLLQGHKIVAVDAGPIESLESLSDSSRGKLELYRTDLSDKAWLSTAMAGVDLCFHLASKGNEEFQHYLPVERQQEDHQVLFNGESFIDALSQSLNVFEVAARADNTPVIFPSCDSVYGPNITYPLTENTCPMPISARGLYKYQVEQYARHFNLRYGLPVTALRLFNVYGMWQDEWQGDVISRFCQAVLNQQPVTLFGNGEQERDFIHMDDVVQGFIKAGRAGFSGFNVFNLCTSEGTSLNRLLDIISSLQGRPMQRNYEPHRSGDLNSAIGCNLKAQRQISFRAEIPIAEGLRQVLKEAGAITLQKAV